MQLISPDKRTLRVSKLRETLYNEKMFHLSKEDAERLAIMAPQYYLKLAPGEKAQRGERDPLIDLYAMQNDFSKRQKHVA